jgi:putative transposase
MKLPGGKMSAHVFSEIFLHINWHTKNDRPVLKADVEQYVHQYIRNRCRQTTGIFFEEVGGTDDHVHLAVRIEPTTNIDNFIGEVKGACSFETNKHHKRKTLEWQIGYGVVSFGKKQLPWVLKYVRNQRSHHAKGTTFARLEATTSNIRKPAEAG